MSGIVGFLTTSIIVLAVGIIIIRRQFEKMNKEEVVCYEIPDEVWERLSRKQTAEDMIEEATRHDDRAKRIRPKGH